MVIFKFIVKINIIFSVQKTKDFLIMYKNPYKELINVMNTKSMKQISENKRKLKPIIETIVFQGWQNILLRGHSDSRIFNQKVNSILLILNTDSIIKKGTFWEFLKLRISCGDWSLKSFKINLF